MTPFSPWTCCSLFQLLFLGFKNMSSTRSPYSPQILRSACQAFINYWLVFAFNIHSGCTSHYIKRISWPCPFFVLPHFHRFQLNLKKEFLGIAWQLLSSPRSGILTRETVQLNCSDGPDYDTSPTLWLWLALTMYIAVIQPNVRQSHLWTLNLSPLCHCEELRKLSDVIIRHRLQGKK